MENKLITIGDDGDMGCKVQLFWEGHKNVGKRPCGFEIYLVNAKTIKT